jgi:Carbohydrate-selective porin, OprB family
LRLGNLLKLKNRSRFVGRSFAEGGLVSRKILKREAHVAPPSTPLRMPPMTGRDASEDLVGNFLTISNIAGFNTLRMDELWFQQNLLDDRISIRFGQIRADTEFVVSEVSALFLNATLGFPAFMYTNLPDGGPVCPMGTLGIRLALTPVKYFTSRQRSLRATSSRRT